MPLYEYECTSCHRHTEKIQKFSDPELTVCPHCGGHLERTVTAPAIQFKGSGWYKDLYSSSKPAPAGGSGTESGAAPAGNTGDGAATPKAEPSSNTSPAPAAAPASTASNT
jgi:putative FmdB family regulatory protein